MKKIIKSFAITAVVLAAAACTNEVEDTPMSFSRELTFIASREGVSPDTKTVRMDDGSTWWNASEEISLFYGSGTGGGDKLTSQNTTLQKIVDFSGSVTITGSGKEYWAVYPYSQDNECDGNSITTVIPAVQIGSESNFSGDVFPAMAKSSSNLLAFWNICGGIKFSVFRSDITSVTFKGNGGEVLAGIVRVSFNTDGKPEVTEVLEGKTEVSINAPDGDAFKAGKYYYLTLLPTALNGGFTMTFNTATETGSVMSNNSQTVKRSTFGVLKNIDAKVPKWETVWAEPKWVDLGLSVKWATFNVGATKPEEYGDYYAWGETKPKDNYDWSTYKWCNGSYNTLTKYNNSSSHGTVDNLPVLVPDGDVAATILGRGWRMPMETEWEELLNNCTWTWTNNYNDTGIAGMIVTSNIAGYTDKSIFLPARGRKYSSFIDFTSFGYYWSSSLFMTEPFFAWSIEIRSDRIINSGLYRYYGFFVRPVYEDSIPKSITLDKSTLELSLGESRLLNVTLSPSNAYSSYLYWISEDSSIVSVNENGAISALSEGTTSVTVYTLNGLCASCDVTVVSLSSFSEPKAIDLGLSVKWASFNLGAAKPDDNGVRFAWGETEFKTDYSWISYKYSNGDFDKLTKYCPTNNPGYWDGEGEPDDLTLLEQTDDAASIKLGGDWRIPTYAEWAELMTNCSFTWTDNYNGTGIGGMVVTSGKAGYTDKVMFLPYTGGYWSSSLNTSGNSDGPNYAFLVTFGRGGVWGVLSNRYFGRSVRPVTE